jgi:hypothetical protein
MEEEISPNWEEIFPFMSSTALERRLATSTTTSFQEPIETGCIVEEEISPLDLGQNSTPTMDENPATNFVTANEFATTTMDADPDDEQARDDEANE